MTAITAIRSHVKYLYIDLFCGAGGTTTGVELAVDKHGRRKAKVIACVNHDPNAINSHYKNHPHVRHFTENIKTLGFPADYILEGTQAEQKKYIGNSVHTYMGKLMVDGIKILDKQIAA